MRWLRGQTIRARITIASVIVAAVLLSIAAFGFRSSVDAIVANSTHMLLQSDSAPYEAAIDRKATKTFPRPDESQFISVIDPKGVVRVSSLTGSLQQRLPQLQNLEDGVHVVRTSTTQEYDVYSQVVVAASGDWHILAARSRTTGQVVLNGLNDALIGGSIALVAAFGIVSWIVTGLSLRPVSRMRRQAAALSQSATADTLPVGPVRDELSALAETLNVFITSVRSSADRERQMVANASHELRTPIAVLRTQLQLAHLSTGDADALEREIAAAEQTVERLSSLTTSLLTLSRIEAPEPGESLPRTPGEVITAEFLSAMDRAIILGSAHSVGVDFTTSGMDAVASLPLLAVDFAGLVDNLVANAIAASPEGSSVDVELLASGGNVTLSVVDSGHGIPDDFLAVAFDRFSRTEYSRIHRIGGSGLGLAIVKAIATASGGEVRLEQRPSGGVRAIVQLPAESAARATEAAKGTG